MILTLSSLYMRYLVLSIVLILATYECLLVFLVVLQVALLRLIKYILSYLILSYDAFYHRCIEYVKNIVLNTKGIQ